MANLDYAEWSNLSDGVDLHVLPKFNGPDLRGWLYATSAPPRRKFRLDDPNPDPAINVAFEPYFRYAINGSLLRGFGVEVDGTNGETRFDLSIANRNPARPAPTNSNLRLYNFLLYAHVNGPDPERPAPAQRNIDRAIRVHLHQSIRRVWATPAVFSVASDVKIRQRLTILAEFDDDVIGNITYWSRIQKKFKNWRALAPLAADPNSPDPASPFPDAFASNLGFRLLNNPAPGTEFFVLGDFDYDGTTHTVKVRVRVTQPWTTPGQVTRLDASGPPSSLYNLSTTRNVLFVPEGFASTQQAAFEALARNISVKLRTEQVTIPFNTFRENTIYWSAWRPSPQAGTTNYREMRLVTRGTQLLGNTLPQPNPPGSLSKPWKAAELLQAESFTPVEIV